MSKFFVVVEMTLPQTVFFLISNRWYKLTQPTIQYRSENILEMFYIFYNFKVL